MRMKSSEKIKAALLAYRERGGDPFDICEATCTAGYDNDGSTGFDIFENGVILGHKAFGDFGPDAKPGYGTGKIFYAQIEEDNGPGSVFFFLGDEYEAVERIEAAN